MNIFCHSNEWKRTQRWKLYNHLLDIGCWLMLLGFAAFGVIGTVTLIVLAIMWWR